MNMPILVLAVAATALSMVLNLTECFIRFRRQRERRALRQASRDSEMVVFNVS
ncbi:IMV protein [Eastern grey kangaroopox virus]|uniref:IMV protein n=1 Tax=Eastern grey kangaroopox virus TaxID=2042482 RepID=A0A2C9DSZ7_9POXV|nr:IMV protein [Eastern grey kangaroopox virus]ATI21130.1 IMV protein [Eastern grey kangaroopox virus]ATX75028.1 IMV protein [Eastern grey kangaroopox virus]